MGGSPKPLQNLLELARFTDEIVHNYRVTSFLEIGSKFGGTLVRIAAAMPIGSKIVSVDLEARHSWLEVIQDLNQYWVAHRFKGDSKDPEIIEKVRQLGPYNLVFIDGGHDEATVRSDWLNYGPMAKMVAFHDISWVQGTRDIVIDVPKVWEELKQQYRHKEFRSEKTDNGIGVLWHEPVRERR
jgi:hypothetical protein